MSANQSLENLLLLQTQKLLDLETATELIQSKKSIQEDLGNAYAEVCSIKNQLQDMRDDITIMKRDNERCKELSAILDTLNQQIQHMENNIPSQIQEYVESELPKINNNVKSIDYANNTLNNTNFVNGDTRNGGLLASGMKNCKKTLFSETEIPCIQPVTQSEFSNIPKYIIGRHSIDMLNSIISNINQIIKAKYSIINLGKNGAKKKGELDLYLHYIKEQMTLGPDEERTSFFTSKDFEKYMKMKLDKTKLNLLVALRHCKRLREIRTAKTVHYALILPNV